MVEEPRVRHGLHKPGSHNPYQGRWRWWYGGIADWLIRNPGGTAQDCARDLGRHAQTVGFIMNSDMFQEYFAQRRAEWQKNHDFAIVSRVTQVAEKSLDVLLQKLETQGDKIPMQTVAALATGALDRLGYAPKTGPQVSIAVDQSKNQQVIVQSISPEALEEARDAMRAVERQRTIEHREQEFLSSPRAGGDGRVVESEPAPVEVLEPDSDSEGR